MFLYISINDDLIHNMTFIKKKRKIIAEERAVVKAESKL